MGGNSKGLGTEFGLSTVLGSPVVGGVFLHEIRKAKIFRGQSNIQFASDVVDPAQIPKNIAAVEAVQAQQKAGIEENIVAIQQKQRRSDQLERVVSAANAEQAARGFSLGSGSFKAIQSNSFDDFARDERVINMNNKFQQDAINQNISNINQMNKFNDLEDIFAKALKVVGGVFGGVAGAKAAGSAASKTSPVTEKTNLGGFDTDSAQSLQGAFDQSSDKDFSDAFSYTPEEEETF